MSRLSQTVAKAYELWQQYEECNNNHRLLGIEDQTERAYNFYEGEQWKGLESGNEELPIYNFIAPVVRYKTAMVAMNNISINFSAPTASASAQALCAKLTSKASCEWERMKMDNVCWDAVKAAMIAGDSYVYFYDGEGNCQLIDRCDIFLADETLPDLSKQPFIFIKERKDVQDIRREADQNKIPKDTTLSIQPDDDSDNKCTSLLKLWLEEDGLHFLRLTRTVVYQPEQVIKGLDCYPVASLVYNRRRGSFRGVGEVAPLISNQIEVNRNLARRILNAKLTAYSRLVYASDRIVNPKALTEVGTAIEVDGGGVSTIRDAVNYLTPSSMSPDAKTLSDELLSVTKDLAGAGDAALGNIDPTQASGTAIIAVRDQSALPLNEHTARFRQFAEDIAHIWYKLWVVYNPDGIELADGVVASARELICLEPEIRVDISNTTPFSKYAREQALERLFSQGHITFEEYVSALDDDSGAPRAKLEQIIKNRKSQAYTENEEVDYDKV